MKEPRKAYFHLPGLFGAYDFYAAFLPLFFAHREYFYDWCEIGSIYGAPAGCLWGGGRVSGGTADPARVAALLRRYCISARLTFSNALLGGEHLRDRQCNNLCALFAGTDRRADAGGVNAVCGTVEASGANAAGGAEGSPVRNGVIVHADLLAQYLARRYPALYLVSSTTKVLTDFRDFRAELQRAEFAYVVPDFRLNRQFAKLAALKQSEKDKVEFLCNECCDFGCAERKACYEAVSRKNLGEAGAEHICPAPYAAEGYRFSRAMKNPGFIGLTDIRERYVPMGFSHFKIEGRGLGTAILLEFLLYYLTRPEHQLEVREALYLDSMLDLF